ncbi:septum site-determining protein MinC [Enterobacteriaceae bacterium LUAb1]
MSQTPIELKGSSFTLPVIHLHHDFPDVVREAIQSKISQAPAFLKNAPVVINVSRLSAGVNWPAMQQAITATGLRIVGVSGCDNEQLKAALVHTGVPILSEGKTASRQIADNASSQADSTAPPTAPKTKIINTPVRSGQQIYAKNGDLIVTSNVSAGAELISDGNIHVYGIMRGRALAGASGARDCQIFCTHLTAELMSIAGEYWLMDQIPAAFLGKAARLYLEDGALTIQTLIQTPL